MTLPLAASISIASVRRLALHAQRVHEELVFVLRNPCVHEDGVQAAEFRDRGLEARALPALRGDVSDVEEEAR